MHCTFPPASICLLGAPHRLQKGLACNADAAAYVCFQELAGFYKNLLDRVICWVNEDRMYYWQAGLTAYRMPLAEGDCMPCHCQILDTH